MTMQMIRTTKQHAELADARKDFIQLARYAMLAKGKTLDARAHAEAEGASSRVQRILTKAEPGLVSAPGGSPETWGSAPQRLRQAEAAFVASLRNVGAYDRMLADMIQVPLRTRLAVSWTAIVAAETGEAEAKAVHDLNILGDTLTPKKVAAIVVLTRELVRAGGAIVEQLIDRELRSAVVAGTDALVLADLVAETTPISSSGNVHAASNIAASFRQHSNMRAAISLPSTARSTTPTPTRDANPATVRPIGRLRSSEAVMARTPSAVATRPEYADGDAGRHLAKHCGAAPRIDRGGKMTTSGQCCAIALMAARSWVSPPGLPSRTPFPLRRAVPPPTQAQSIEVPGSDPRLLAAKAAW